MTPADIVRGIITRRRLVAAEVARAVGVRRSTLDSALARGRIALPMLGRLLRVTGATAAEVVDAYTAAGVDVLLLAQALAATAPRDATPEELEAAGQLRLVSP